MKKLLTLFVISVFFSQSVIAADFAFLTRFKFAQDDARAIKSVLNSQVRYANRTNFEKFISTYDNSYENSDGFNIDTYSA
ncbi:hypothetical protein IKQ21_05970, partial [bacterium]|nr:hypothetical protein [bacterium]